MYFKPRRGEEEAAVVNLLTEKMGFEKAPALANAHPIGKKDDHRNIIVRFVRWEDRQNALFNGNKLKETVFGSKTDLPARLQSKRVKLLKKRKEMKATGVIVRVIERGRGAILQTKTSAKAERKTAK